MTRESTAQRKHAFLGLRPHVAGWVGLCKQAKIATTRHTWLSGMRVNSSPQARPPGLAGQHAVGGPAAHLDLGQTDHKWAAGLEAPVSASGMLPAHKSNTQHCDCVHDTVSST